VKAQRSKSNRTGRHRSHLHGDAGSRKYRTAKKDRLVEDARRLTKRYARGRA